ncbi:hypothetical protein IFM89_000687 [Coptis chinensis]|uniref:PSD13 N-terminal domain-containing protein n=1 Tax=Coptis chinensis TaxID=261450 RepID=A0A835HZP0_9MAGN|nr:hypothetical protein IFM89_000687 [Coptis chinensis]
MILGHLNPSAGGARRRRAPSDGGAGDLASSTSDFELEEMEVAVDARFGEGSMERILRKRMLKIHSDLLEGEEEEAMASATVGEGHRYPPPPKALARAEELLPVLLNRNGCDVNPLMSDRILPDVMNGDVIEGLIRDARQDRVESGTETRLTLVVLGVEMEQKGMPQLAENQEQVSTIEIGKDGWETPPRRHLIRRSHRESHPELAEWYTELADLYEKKLWHQLTLKLDQFISLPVFQAGNALIDLYNNFIMEFETKINPLKFSHFAILVSRQVPERLEANTFLQAVIEKLQDTKELGIQEL